MQRTDHVPEHQTGSRAPESFDLGTGLDRDATQPGSELAGDEGAGRQGAVISGAGPATDSDPAIAAERDNTDGMTTDADRMTTDPDRAADDRAANDGAVEERRVEDRGAEDRAVADRAAEDRGADDGTVEDRAADDQDRENSPAPASATAPESASIPAPRDTTERANIAEAMTAAERDQAGMHRAPSGTESLLGSGQTTDFRGRWREIQTGFVDDPAAAVQSAQVLLREVTVAITTAVDERGATPVTDTEELRVRLRDYRQVVNRLLEV